MVARDCVVEHCGFQGLEVRNEHLALMCFHRVPAPCTTSLSHRKVIWVVTRNPPQRHALSCCRLQAVQAGTECHVVGGVYRDSHLGVNAFAGARMRLENVVVVKNRQVRRTVGR